MDALPSVKFTVISTTPLVALEDRLHVTIPLDMTWAPAHMSQVSSVFHFQVPSYDPTEQTI